MAVERFGCVTTPSGRKFTASHFVARRRFSCTVLPVVALPAAKGMHEDAWLSPAID